MEREEPPGNPRAAEAVGIFLAVACLAAFAAGAWMVANSQLSTEGARPGAIMLLASTMMGYSSHRQFRRADRLRGKS